MYSLALRLLDSAHVVPAARPERSGEAANGIALCGWRLTTVARRTTLDSIVSQAASASVYAC